MHLFPAANSVLFVKGGKLGFRVRVSRMARVRVGCRYTPQQRMGGYRLVVTDRPIHLLWSEERFEENIAAVPVATPDH